jgi:DNA-binding Lrp family transcriptional regulator
MDPITEQALALLRRDGRSSFSDLARRLDTTRANIARRIGPLLDSGQLRVVAAIHPRLLGLDVLAHVSIRAEGDIAALAAAIAELDSPVFVSEVSGSYQIIAELHTTDLGALHRDLRRLRAFPGVVEVQVLLYERMLKSFFLGEEPGLAAPTLDEIDLEIMEQLQEDGRLGFADLGERVGLSLSSCRARVNRLIESGAMQIGAIMQRGEDTTSGLPFGFGFGLTGDDKHLIALLETHPGCEFIARTIGRFDLVATIWFPGLADFNAFLTAARALEGVRITEQWLHVRIRQERYQYSLHRIRNGRLTQAS